MKREDRLVFSFYSLIPMLESWFEIGLCRRSPFVSGANMVE